VLAWVAALQASGKVQRAPVLIVCPVTLMGQWIREAQHWWPPLRVMRLHSSYSGRDMRSVLRKSASHAHILITSYGHLRLFAPVFGKREWRAVVLDEGHAIRNPDAAVTGACKRLRTAHRLILSGTPVQNGLGELWSLVDFCAPGLLGTLPVFKAELAQPIVAGGYLGAGTLQVQTAYRCACLLRETLQSVLLRRVKSEVAAQLPPKEEHVLFCELSAYQRQLYEWLLECDVIQGCLAGKRNLLAGIDLLRKVCNDPDLILDSPLADHSTFPHPGSAEEAQPGKLRVVKETLKMWRARGHRALLFCQTRQMLDRVESLIISEGSPYLRMDGTTSIKDRARLVDTFNSSPGIPIFLLTTRVGGLGLNLTGADRVLIYDPDWNPSTDLQARERAWRLGQSRPVTIYRLLAAGTIEEKIYQRQLWKQALTSRVLTDPKQARFFKAAELYDLFSLAPQSCAQTETGGLLSGLGVETSRIRDWPDDRINDQEIEPSVDGHMVGAEHLTSPTSDPILAGLFHALPELHSAIAHDRLTERPRQERILVEREAERMARGAADALRRSRAEREAQPVEEPTWTGKRQHGIGIGKGVGSNTHVGAVPSSAAILAAVRARSQPAKEQSSPEGLDDRMSRVLDRLLRFLADSPGRSSAEIAERFKDQLAPGQEAAFRALLRTVALLDGVSKCWRLKPGLLNS